MYTTATDSASGSRADEVQPSVQCQEGSMSEHTDYSSKQS